MGIYPGPLDCTFGTTDAPGLFTPSSTFVISNIYKSTFDIYFAS